MRALLALFSLLLATMLAAPSAARACDPGEYVASVFGACADCAPGTFSSTTDAPSCSDCPLGTIAPAPGSTVCTPCAPGTFTPSPGSTSCLTCPAGSITAPSGGSCLPCPAGTQPNGSLTACVPCAPGSYGVGGSCTVCAPGFFAPSPGQSSCQACPAGTAAASPGASTCSDCPLGRFAPAPASATCTVCPVDTYADTTASTSCTPCPGGSSSPAGSPDISACIVTCDPQVYDCDPLLPLLSSTPMTAGNPVTFTVSNVPPGATVYLAVSLLGPGSTCPGAVPGCFTLKQATSLPPTTASASGVATRTVTVPATFGAQPAWVQAVVSSSGSTGVSPVVLKVVNDTDDDFFLDAIDTCPLVSDPQQIDVDLDGFGAACDCNDFDSATFPGAPDPAGGIDADCDGNP